VNATQILESAYKNKTRFLIEYNQGPGKGDAFVTFAVKHGCKIYNFNYTTYVVMNLPPDMMRQEDEITDMYTN
jgi:hypothetical protein